jgi:DNA-binding transcriptional LysR family regulator
MFTRLFSERGLSLDRLKALLEVGAAGSIVKAAEGDAVRQSQYSRQIKELEDFFRVRLVERQGKGTRLTGSGKELARISRFFLLGLSNFQRGCLAKEQTFTIGGSATFLRQLVLPALSEKDGTRYATEVAGPDEIERRLHDLTLDFGIVGNSALSRPLQTRKLGEWRLGLWASGQAGGTKAKAGGKPQGAKWPLILAWNELAGLGLPPSLQFEARLLCDNFLDAKTALETHPGAAFLPDFLMPTKVPKGLVRVAAPEVDSRVFQIHLAWNPRSLRLNPAAARRRDLLADWLSAAAGAWSG